jgi:hypothetical protein
VFAVLILAILLASLVSPGSSFIIYSTGLKPGDTVMYSLSGSYKSNTNNAQMRVLSVTGTQVTANFTSYPASGFTLGKMWIDIFTGQSSNFTSNLFDFVVASGLKTGDPIFNNWTNITILSQFDTCGGLSRPTIYTRYGREGQLVQISWDQNTGVMCSYSAMDPSGRGLGFSLDNTTLWSSPTSLDTFAVAAEVSAALGLPLVVLIVVVYFRKKRARKRGS